VDFSSGNELLRESGSLVKELSDIMKNKVNVVFKINLIYNFTEI
jgi:hypothetical protein